VSSRPSSEGKVLRRWAVLVEADGAILGHLEAVGSTRPLPDVLQWDLPFSAESLRCFAEYADKIGGEVAATESRQAGSGSTAMGAHQIS
jgi:aldehyde dehydrogenase (NAD+)